LQVYEKKCITGYFSLAFIFYISYYKYKIDAENVKKNPQLFTKGSSQKAMAGLERAAKSRFSQQTLKEAF
jgi:hypothetical protein